MSNSLPFLMLEAPCGSDKNCASCEVTPCSDATRIQDATRLIQAGARATLVCQLTDLPKKLVKRMYTMLQGQPSPRGQMPFTDAWYLETDLRMLMQPSFGNCMAKFPERIAVRLISYWKYLLCTKASSIHHCLT